MTPIETLLDRLPDADAALGWLAAHPPLPADPAPAADPLTVAD
jgi:hypothetical protein